MNKNFSQKGFTSNFLGFMKDLERNKLCCLDFLTQVYTENSESVTFTGFGTKSSPLIATATSSGGTPGGSDNSIQYAESGVFAGDSNFTWNPTTQVLNIIGGAGQALQIAPTTGNLLIGTTTDAGQLLQVAGIGAFAPSGGVGTCLQLGTSSYINTAFIMLGESSQAPGFQEWVFQMDTTGNMRILEAISGQTTAIFSVLNSVPQFSSHGAFYPGQYSTTDKLALVVQGPGAMVYDTDLNKLCVYNGTSWETVTSV